MTENKDKKPEPTVEEPKTDEAILSDALDGKVPETKTPAPVKADTPAEPKSDEDKTEVPAAKAKQYKTPGDAIKGALHWEKVAGKVADESGKKDRTILALEARLIELEQQMKNPPKPKEEAPEDEEDNPLLSEIEKRARRIVDERLKPLQDNEARNRAKQYQKSMESKWGETWEGLQEQRDALVSEWKSSKLLEPELWQYAVVGKMFLDKQITTDHAPVDDTKSGALDRKSSTKTPGEIEKPGGDKTDESVLSDALSGLMRRPAGTAPVH